jgi:hypothetical protein
MAWTTQQINLKTLNPNAMTNAPASITDPFVSVYQQQQHIAFKDKNGVAWDAWYNPAPNEWNLQQINFEGSLPTTEGLSIGVYNNQQHFVSVAPGTVPSYSGINVQPIQDSWYDGSNWHLQEIDAKSGGPMAAWSGPLGGYEGRALCGPTFRVAIWNYGTQQQHFTYLNGSPGAVYDAFWDGGANKWHIQLINNAAQQTPPPPTPLQASLKPLTNCPWAVGDPFASVFITNASAQSGQQHIAYRDQNGIIWDAWYDPAGPNQWNTQQINLAGGTRNGPAAIGGPCIWTVPGGSGPQKQQHFTYVAGDGSIQDAWYDGVTVGWNLQQLNLGGPSALVPAVGVYEPAFAPIPSGLSACIFGYFTTASSAITEQHVAYRDKNGVVWDAWYDGSGPWSVRQINLSSGPLDGPPAAGDPFVWAWYYQYGDNLGNYLNVYQLHFTYRDINGGIQDVYLAQQNTESFSGGRG